VRYVCCRTLSVLRLVMVAQASIHQCRQRSLVQPASGLGDARRCVVNNPDPVVGLASLIATGALRPAPPPQRATPTVLATPSPFPLLPIPPLPRPPSCTTNQLELVVVPCGVSSWHPSSAMTSRIYSNCVTRTTAPSDSSVLYRLMPFLIIDTRPSKAVIGQLVGGR
jgi:hypothetical protein